MKLKREINEKWQNNNFRYCQGKNFNGLFSFNNSGYIKPNNYADNEWKIKGKQK